MEPRPAQTAQEVLMYACFTNNREYADMALYRKFNTYLLGEKHVNDMRIPGFEALPEIDKLDINYREPRQGNATPLILCARKGHKEIANKLITIGADVNLCADRNISPLHQAMTHYHYEIATDLLEAGAFPVDEISKNSPYLHICLNHRVCELMLLTGAYVNQKDKDGNTPLHAICSAHPIPDLVPAIEYLQIVKLLTAFGADVRAKNNLGQSAIDLLVHNSDIPEDEKRAIVALLVSHGAENQTGFKPGVYEEEKGSEAEEKLIVELFEKVKENRRLLKGGDIEKASEGFSQIEEQMKGLQHIKSPEGKNLLAICYNELAFHQHTSPQQLDKVASYHGNQMMNWQVAVSYYLKAMRLFYDTGNMLEYANARLNHMNALIQTGQQIKLKDVIACKEVMKDDKRVVKADNLISLLNGEAKNEFEDARDLILGKNDQDPVEKANHLDEIGEVREALNARIDLIQKEPNLINLHNVSESLLHVGKYEDANKFQIEALNGFIKEQNAVGVIQGFGNLARIARSVADYKSALEYHEQELNIALELKDAACLAESFWNNALTHFHMKNYGEAFDAAMKGMEYAKQSGKQKWISTCGMQAMFMEFVKIESKRPKLFGSDSKYDHKELVATMATLQQEIMRKFALGDWIGGAYLACVAQAAGIEEAGGLMETSLSLAKGNGYAYALNEIEQVIKQGFWKE